MAASAARPIIGKVIREFLPREHLLSYLEAILRVYNQEGRRDNIYKARIKILVKAKGIEAFRAAVDAEWELIRESRAEARRSTEIDRVRGLLPSAALRNRSPTSTSTQGQSADFQAWYRYNTRPHKVPGYRAVIVSLKAHGEAPGDITADADGSRRRSGRSRSSGEVRATHDQNLVLGEVRQIDLLETWQALKAHEPGDAEHRHAHRHDLLPGARFLQPGQCRLDRHRQADPRALQRFRLPLRPRPHRDQDVRLHECLRPPPRRPHRHPRRRQARRGVVPDHPRWFGRQQQPRWARSSVRRWPRMQWPKPSRRILDVYVAQREDGEEFLETVRRIGVEPFSERVYAAAH